MRGFTEQEKELIRTSLLQKGRELFSNFGLKKTSIKDLTDSVGIAQGSFYLFYQSKEELYFRVLEQEEDMIKKAIVHDLTLPMTADGLTKFLLKGIELISEHVLIQRLYFQGELELLVRKLPQEVMEAHINQDNDLLTPLLQGIEIKQEQMETIGGAIRAFFIMALHKKEIGEEHYNSTLEFLARAIANQIFKDDEK